MFVAFSYFQINKKTRLQSFRFVLQRFFIVNKNGEISLHKQFIIK